MKKREKERKIVKEDAYDSGEDGFADTDTRILDRSIRKQTKFDAWLWKNVALNPQGCLEINKVVYGSAGDLKMSAVTTRRYLLERCLRSDPYYSIHNSMVWFNGIKKV